MTSVTRSLFIDAHPCEGPGSDPQDLLPDDRAWGSRTPPTQPVMTAALPVSVPPQAGESIESWLEHLADANCLTTAQLLAAAGRGIAGTRYLSANHI